MLKKGGNGFSSIKSSVESFSAAMASEFSCLATFAITQEPGEAVSGAANRFRLYTKSSATTFRSLPLKGLLHIA